MCVTCTAPYRLSKYNVSSTYSYRREKALKIWTDDDDDVSSEKQPVAET